MLCKFFTICFVIFQFNTKEIYTEYLPELPQLNETEEIPKPLMDIISNSNSNNEQLIGINSNNDEIKTINPNNKTTTTDKTNYQERIVDTNLKSLEQLSIEKVHLNNENIESNDVPKTVIPQFLKIENDNNRLKFSPINNKSDLVSSNSRQPILMDSNEFNGNNEKIDSIIPNYRMLGISNVKAVGVPIKFLLNVLQANSNIEGDISKGVTDVKSITERTYDTDNGLLQFIKSSARSIGNVVFGTP